MTMGCEEERAVAHLPAGRSRIFVDCTQTVSRPVTTGIPRVVRKIVEHGSIAARGLGAELVPVRFQRGRFMPLDATGVAVSPDVSPRSGWFPGPKLRKILVPRSLARRIAALAARLRPAAAAGDGVSFAAGDVLLLPDSSWHEEMWTAVDEARAAGVALGVIQHDFIPVRHSEIVPPAVTVAFRRWIDATLGRADFVLAVSEVVARETRMELLKRGRAEVAKRHVTSFRNGCDFTAGALHGARRRAPVRRELRDFLAADIPAPYLTVGTIEPRKNQSLLLAAFDDLRAQAPATRLLIAGRVGWRGAPIVAAFRRHPGWGSAIIHFDDLSDAELRYAYRRCGALVFPSLAEGYGLPLVEALASGLRVFASDIAVHREVGGDHCVYFDPERPAALAPRLGAFSRAGTYPARWPPPRAALPTWAAAADRIVATALAHSRAAMVRPAAVKRLRSAG